MNLKLKKLNRDIYIKIASYLAAFAIFLCMSPYFLWKTYLGIDINLVALVELIFICCSLLCLLLYGKCKVEVSSVVLFIGIIFLGIVIYFFNGNGVDFYPARLLPLACIGIFMLFSTQRKKIVFEYFMTIFAISLLPGMLYFILEYIGVNVPYVELQAQHAGKTAIYQFYRNYFGAVRIDAYYVDFTHRLCGMFDEPGVVGTFCAFFIIAKRFNLKDWRCIVFGLAGIMSLSIAFFVLIGFSILLQCLSRDRKARKMVILAMVFFVLMLLAFPDLLMYLLSRFENNSIIDLLNKRIKNVTSYNTEMNNFITGPISTLFFGMGYNASLQNSNMAGSYIFSMPFYDHGIVGILLMIIWLWLVYRAIIKLADDNSHRQSVLFYFLVFISSIFQRPYVFELYYMVTLIGGGLLLAEKK